MDNSKEVQDIETVDSKKSSIEIIGGTFELNKIVELAKKEADESFDTEKAKQLLKDGAVVFSGKAAGVCYMPDNYTEVGIQNEKSAIKRAEGCGKSGHHSVFDHCTVNLLISTSKMMAMALNSLGVYTTSEKSARYTKMKPKTELENTLYNKWREKFRGLILKKYEDYDDEALSKALCKKLGIDYDSNAVQDGSLFHIKDDEYMEEELEKLKKDPNLPSYKLAQENARYMISVFTPTTMIYSVSFRQVALIIDYLDRLIKECDKSNDLFSKQLEEEAIDLKKAFEDTFGDLIVKDTKNQYIRFFAAQHQKANFMDSVFKKDQIGDSYTITYTASLAMIAQAQRHRTIRYTMYLSKPAEFGFYVPEIIKGTALENEWLADISSVKDIIPQGTLVKITEQGIFEDFALKCKERLCGRAQLEICKKTAEIVQLFLDNKENLSTDNQLLLSTMTQSHMVCPRCMFSDYRCSGSCFWGAAHALTREI